MFKAAHKAIRWMQPLVTASAAALLMSCGGATDSAEGANSESKKAIASVKQSKWSALLPLNFVPVSAANLPDGKVLLWAGSGKFSFSSDGNAGQKAQTYSTVFDPDPAATSLADHLVTETDHEMFCVGTSNLPDGRVLVTGGSNSGSVSLYDPALRTWSKAAEMNIHRAYHANTVLQDGSVFVLGGSWNGGKGGKDGEVWTEATGWRHLTGVPITPFETRTLQPNGQLDNEFTRDSHFWLIPSGNGKVFYPGPGVNMQWIDTQGNGRVIAAGKRGDDGWAINGNTVMVDTGKVLKVGGATAYNDVDTSNSAYVIDLNYGANVRKLSNMTYPRAYHNSVVLPDGKVVIIGGQTHGKTFHDDYGVLLPELWDPETEKFTVLDKSPILVARNYHSVAHLLPDGRVMSAGGGLSGDADNHPDLQILTPYYLLNADGTPATRPVLTSAPSQANHGTTMRVAANSKIAKFALVRMSSSTHTVNNDQRRLSLSFTDLGSNRYDVKVPSNPGWAVPGRYMLFAMDDRGVPSVAKLVTIGDPKAPRIMPIDDATGTTGAPFSLQVMATGNGMALTYGANGLPPGVTINTTTGLISGVPYTPGRFTVSASVSDGVQTISTEFVIQVSGAPTNPHAPVLTSPANQSSVAGSSVSVQLSATDPDGGAITYQATGLPPGLSVAPGSGLISGVVGGTGAYAVTVTASDPQGYVDQAQFTWTVIVPSVVTIEPISVGLINEGATASYTVKATGHGTLEYRWDFGDGTAPTAFGPSANITHVFADAGVYTVTVTVRDDTGAESTRTFSQPVTNPVAGGKSVSSSNLLYQAPNGGNPRLWVVNADNDTVSVFDTISLTKLAEIGVGAAPRAVAQASDGRVWVTNKTSATVSVIDPATLKVVQTVGLPRGSMPHGVAAASDGFVYVVLEATGKLLKFPNAGTSFTEATVGLHARHVAWNGALQQAMVSRFITPPQPGESTKTVSPTLNGVPQGGEVVVVNAKNMKVLRTVVLQHSALPDSNTSARGVPNYLGAPAISPDGLSAWVPSKQDNIYRGTYRDNNNITFETSVRAISSRIDLKAQKEDLAQRVDHDNSGMASAAAFHPSGAWLFVALEASREVAVMDANGARELFRVKTGRTPQGLLVSPDGLKLFVNNYMDRTVGVYDLTPLVKFGLNNLPLAQTWKSVAAERLTPTVLKGKQFFYDAADSRLAKDGYLSCAVCHNDGGQDGRVWDLTGMGEGLRNTIALKGRAGIRQGMLHWSSNFDEVQDFEGQIRGLARGDGLMTDAQFNATSQTLGPKKAGLSTDLDALAAYLGSLDTFANSPLRPGTNQLSADATVGKALFASQGCGSCHSGSAFTKSGNVNGEDIGTTKPSSGKRLGGADLKAIDVPTLRDVWATAPYLHDGSAPTLQAAITAHRGVNINAADLDKLVAYVREIGAEEVTAPVPTNGGGGGGGAGTGLTGAYYPNMDFSGVPVLTRTEAVDFDWSTGSPGPGVPVDQFSVRWTGKLVVPNSGTYLFQTESDDGVTLWVNGVRIINNWTDHGPQLDTSMGVALTAGQSVTVQLDYYEDAGGATVRLRWKPPGSIGFVAIPASQLRPN